MLELVALGSDPEIGRQVARELSGMAYVAVDDRDLPFRCLVRAVTDRPEVLGAAGDVGRYVVFSRVMRDRPEASSPGDPTPGLVAAFPLFRKTSLDREPADRHWREVHAPLALKHHPGMCDYVQLSVVETLSGPAYDGIALCGFADREDMKRRFFGSDEDRRVILDDVAKFTDPVRSLHRVVTQRSIFGPR